MAQAPRPRTISDFHFLISSVKSLRPLSIFIWQINVYHKHRHPFMANIGILADEATITGFLLAGAGCISSGNQKNFHVVDQNVSKADVEAAFEELRNSPDISIIMVSNGVMETIKDTIAEYDLQGKVVMPFPTKDSGLFAS
eukprot:XP_001705194.1 VATPase [Giardia lamblia ATCC 50803]